MPRKKDRMVYAFSNKYCSLWYTVYHNELSLSLLLCYSTLVVENNVGNTARVERYFHIF